MIDLSFLHPCKWMALGWYVNKIGQTDLSYTSHELIQIVTFKHVTPNRNQNYYVINPDLEEILK